MYNKYSVKWEMLILFLDRTSLGTTSRHCRACSIPDTKVTRRGIWKHFPNALERNPHLHLRDPGREIFLRKNFQHHFAKCPSSGVSIKSGEVQLCGWMYASRPTLPDVCFLDRNGFRRAAGKSSHGGGPPNAVLRASTGRIASKPIPRASPCGSNRLP